MSRDNKSETVTPKKGVTEAYDGNVTVIKLTILSLDLHNIRIGIVSPDSHACLPWAAADSTASFTDTFLTHLSTFSAFKRS